MTKKQSKILIGVFGQSDYPINKGIAKKARIIGEELAKSAYVLITGSCGGYPNESIKGAKRFRGEVIGFSPALNLKEHIKKYKLPRMEYGTLIFTNSSFVARDYLNVSSIDAGLIIGGKTGTLHELCIMMESDKVIGVLEKTGGTADLVRILNKRLRKHYQTYKVIYDKDPRKLIEKVVKEIKLRRQE